MSIWCSWEAVGWDDEADEPTPNGSVRSYASGWSNHYPTNDDTVEMPSTISLAHIAPWCVPGHPDATETAAGECGDWLRLTVDTWEHNWKAPTSIIGDLNASVVLDETAARTLRDQLTDWLARPKLTPKEQA